MIRAYKFLLRPTVRQAQALREMLRDHCSLYNGALQARRDASRTCPSCGHAAKENRFTQAKFQCTGCGMTANADHVGALNVLNRAGLALCDVA
ncbi:zinc ribbon domain-containing protein [Streptomyces flaveus]|uniref:zinc ribbon domain-containing protein n=1 Tax=Streptomyces flaveus TaxID=66370 RepID=UPI00331CA219